ncbi:MAG: hypothetical protein COY80_02550 [Candidatus Pacebacteria bacterium CG_4_10_14_0_8_um_filter_42_14]|nr:MAG: hypothetical protein COY80_02550 [Candidatus Pacebacteria bacterium CG_4_10_14_0_8_um_filter_42_14]
MNKLRALTISGLRSAGFTMIELLIVISILGILAVAVLSAINPVEQINRGRDTGTRSDAEQLLSAIDRFNAFQGYFPWQEDANSTNLGIDDGSAAPLLIDATNPKDDDVVKDCYVLDKLSDGTTFSSTAGCVSSDELKSSFVDRIVNSDGARDMYIYNQGTSGNSTYVCFAPQSKAFFAEAEKRCEDAAGAGLPSDLSVAAKAFLCSGYGTGVDVYSCLP